MASILSYSRLRVLMQARTALNVSSIRDKSIPAESIEKRSPYEELKVEIDVKSNKERPMRVNAYGDERTIACVCDDMHFMTLKKGPPVKCKCGYWFQLVDANKFWLKNDEKDS